MEGKAFRVILWSGFDYFWQGPALSCATCGWTTIKCQDIPFTKTDNVRLLLYHRIILIYLISIFLGDQLKRSRPGARIRHIVWLSKWISHLNGTLGRASTMSSWHWSIAKRENERGLHSKSRSEYPQQAMESYRRISCRLVCLKIPFRIVSQTCCGTLGWPFLDVDWPWQCICDCSLSNYHSIIGFISVNTIYSHKETLR